MARFSGWQNAPSAIEYRVNRNRVGVKEVAVIAPQFIHGVRPEGFLEVDAARLLLVLARFARPASERTFPVSCVPADTFVSHFAS
jgi:hypothetical protein